MHPRARQAEIGPRPGQGCAGRIFVRVAIGPGHPQRGRELPAGHEDLVDVPPEPAALARVARPEEPVQPGPSVASYRLIASQVIGRLRLRMLESNAAAVSPPIPAAASSGQAPAEVG